MKRLVTLTLLLQGLCIAAFAQNLSFTLVTQPCSNNGVLQANVPANITPPLTYTWYVAGTQIVTTSNTLNNYAGGPVYLNVTNPNQQFANGFYAGSPPFNYQVTTTSAICPAMGTATATVTGGTAPFTYQWLLANTNTVVATGNPASLPGGGYDVLITDANGCTYGSYARNDSVYVQYVSPVNFTVSTTPAACTNGTATVSGVTGGLAPYAYLWSNAANTPAITNLTMGTYSVTVTDAQGCHTTQYASISQSINIPVNITPTNPTCVQTNGSAIAFASGGASPYTYLWSNTQATQTATNLSGGQIYSVTATDANGCIGHGSVVLSSSTPIIATYTATASSCTSATGSATVSATGGTTPYTITWNTFPAQTGATAIGLSPGNYNFTVTDAVGCVRKGTAVVPPVSPVAGLISTNPATCTQSNGSASILMTSGTAPFTYAWSNSQTTATATNLASGVYSVTVTDNVGCHITKPVTVQRFSPVSVGFNVTPASCIYAADGSIVATASGGTAPYTYAWSNSQTTATASSLATGYYALTVTDAAGCSRTNSSFVPYNPNNNSCYCTITGTVYNDLNANCVKDAGEPGIPNIMIHCSGLGYAFTNSAGVYSFQAPSGSYTISESVQAYYPLASCQSNAVPVTVTAAANCTTTVNLANVINPIHDVSIQTVSLSGPPVPGNTYAQRVIVTNQGTVTEPAVTVGYRHDGQLGAPLFTPGSYVSNGGNHYSSGASFPSLPVATWHPATFFYSVPTNIPLLTAVQFNDSAAYQAPMSNWLNDYSPWDNVNSYTSIVAGSFDPNNKEVAPRGTGPQGYIYRSDSVLTYTIHFQNTGTWPAQKVVIIDTLSANLDLSSLKPGYATHAYKATASEGGVLQFTFDNINLPDSNSDKLGSMGLATYTVKMKKNLPIGTEIRNSASIYFDYNAPVQTNTTLNTIQNSVGVPGGGKAAGTLVMDLYPNPAATQVAMAIQSGDNRGLADIRIVSISGQTVVSQQVSLKGGRNLFVADVSQLSPGMYFVVVSDGAGAVTRKLSIIR